MFGVLFLRAAGFVPAAAFFASLGAALAEQSSSQFRIAADLQSAAAPSAAFCRTTSRPGVFGATLTIVCSTGVAVDKPAAPARGDAFGYRYLTQVSLGGQILGTVDLYSGLGTVSSWRVVNLADRRYVEVTLSW